jgi:chromosome segregation ATPase
VRFVDGTAARCESLFHFCACLFAVDYVCDLYVFWEQAISLTKVVKRIIADRGEDGLQSRVARLEEENSRVRASSVELQVSADKSAEAVIVLRRELDSSIENYERLREDTICLSAERNVLQSRAADLEEDLARTKASATADVAALQAKVVCVSSCSG